MVKLPLLRRKSGENPRTKVHGINRRKAFTLIIPLDGLPRDGGTNGGKEMLAADATEPADIFFRQFRRTCVNSSSHVACDKIAHPPKENTKN